MSKRSRAGDIAALVEELRKRPGTELRAAELRQMTDVPKRVVRARLRGVPGVEIRGKRPFLYVWTGTTQ